MVYVSPVHSRFCNQMSNIYMSACLLGVFMVFTYIHTMRLHPTQVETIVCGLQSGILHWLHFNSNNFLS